MLRIFYCIFNQIVGKYLSLNTLHITYDNIYFITHAGRKRKLDPLDAAILKSIENISDKKAELRPQMSHWQKWGVWLGTELENIKCDTDRLDLQISLTECLRSFKKQREMPRYD